MNNLNFRAWHKENKRMCSVTAILFDPKRGIKISLESSADWFDWLRGDEVTLMQSTGLKDSKGVEIFFDDLVNFQDTIHRVELDEDYAQPCLSHPYDALSFGDNREDCTVVGNFYQNPELAPIDEDEQPELLGGGV